MPPSAIVEAIENLQVAVEAGGVGGGDASAANQDEQTALLTPGTTGTITVVSDAATSATLAASNAARKMVWIYNDSDQPLYVKFGATATVSDFTQLVIPGATMIVAGGATGYTGLIDGIWSANSSGSARVTVIT